MKKVLLIIASLLFVFLSANCGRTENEAVASPTVSSFSSYPYVNGSLSATVVMTGLMYERRADSTVPIMVDSANLVIAFPRAMSNSATVVLKRVAANEVVQVTTSWDIGTNYSTLRIKPAANLQHKKRYWLQVQAKSIMDVNGNKWDKDGDGVGGEDVDDDYTFYFTTIDTGLIPGSPTEPERFVVDEWKPEFDGAPFCWINGVGQTSVLNTYVNASIYLRITDRLLRSDRISRDTVGPFGGTINDSKVWLMDSETKQKMPATVTLADDPVSTHHIRNSTIKIEPTNLMPKKNYFVVVQQNKIADAAGNKMGTDDGAGGDTAMFLVSTDDSLSGGGVVRADVDGPSITGYSSKRINFNELVDESTINGSTIWYKDASNVQRPLVLTISVEYTDSGKKPYTVVTVTPMAGHTSGTLYVNLRKIKDLAGNYGTGANPDARPL